MSKKIYSEKEMQIYFNAWKNSIENYLIHEPNQKYVGTVYTISDSVFGGRQLLMSSEGDVNLAKEFIDFLKLKGAKVFTNYEDLEKYANKKINE